MKVIEVVNDPCCQQVAQFHGAERWVLSLAVIVGGLEAHAAQEGEALLAQLGELVEELGDACCGKFAYLGKLLEWRKPADSVFGEQDSQPRDPVAPFIVNIVHKDRAGGPSLWVFLELQPGLG